MPNRFRLASALLSALLLCAAGAAAQSSPISVSGPLVAFQGSVYFGAYSPPQGPAQLWRSNGTGVGTRKIHEFPPLTLFPQVFTVVGDRLFFFADSGLWQTDGASEPAPVWTLPASTLPAGAVATGGLLYFTTFDGILGGQMWRSDGTADGTFLLAADGVDRSLAGELVPVGDTLFFFELEHDRGYALWKTDGTPSGTQRVADIVRLGFWEGLYARLGGLLMFVAGGPSAELPYQLWRSDGTGEGTYPLHEFAGEPSTVCPGSCPPPLSPSNLTELGGRLLFFANDGQTGRELWSSDGTAAGTVLVKDIFPGAPGGAFSAIVLAGGSIYFSAQAVATGSASLWSSDGTEAGTVLVPGIPNGPVQQYDGVFPFAAVGNRVLFLEYGVGALFSTDGTDGGVLRVLDVPPGSTSLGSFAPLGDGSQLFTRWDGVATSLLRTDGTPSGTFLVPFGGRAEIVTPESPARTTRSVAPRD